MKDQVRDYLKSKKYPNHVISGGLSRLVKNWELTVDSIARGEEQGYYDYLNDMDGRKILDEVLEIASDKKLQHFKDRVLVADQTAKEHFVEIDECIWGEITAKKYGYRKK
ncbi:MAG: hypothetical protein AAF902_16700 [Chloroflexota bacterium]